MWYDTRKSDRPALRRAGDDETSPLAVRSQFMGSLGAPELLIILVLVLLVFGGAKLPKLARSLGQAQREFKSGLSDQSDASSGGAEAGDSSTKSTGSTKSTNGSA